MSALILYTFDVDYSGEPGAGPLVEIKTEAPASSR